MKPAALALLLLLALPAAASGSRAEVVDGQFRYTAAPGEHNEPGISFEDGEYHVVDNGLGSRFPDVGPGCRRSDQPFGLNHGAICPADGVTSIAVATGDRADLLGIQASIQVPVSYSGGPGIDAVIYPDAAAPAAISADGKADDGPSGHDDIAADVEVLHGTAFNDRLTAGPLASGLRGGMGDDVLAGGAGDDAIRAATVEDTGIESGSFSPDGTDAVTCGAGQDYVLADVDDQVGADCEVVARDRRVGSYAYEIRGSAGPDRIKPREFFDLPARILGGGGADVLRTGADDALYGQGGDDHLFAGGGAGSREANHVFGGPGKDTIDTRDAARDFVSCGPGNRDTAIVDRRDRVARDCERVRGG